MTATNLIFLSGTGQSPSLRRYTQRTFQVKFLTFLSKERGVYSTGTGKSEHKSSRGKYTAVPMVSAVRDRLDLSPVV